MTPMSTEYTKHFNDGASYARYVEEFIWRKLRINLEPYITKEEQRDIGENPQGFEIKFQKPYAKTGNLYIEVKERTSKKMDYVDSGIYREDNAWLWVTGDRETIFILSKKQLKNIHRINDPKWGLKFLACNDDTSQGFLLPGWLAKEMSIIFFENCGETMKQAL
jgi:hypothetical protein